jgi:hypothetical protein
LVELASDLFSHPFLQNPTYEMLKAKKLKLSHYTPWRRLGGEEV